MCFAGKRQVNVSLDVLTEDPQWFGWFSDALARCADNAAPIINPFVYAEDSICFRVICS